MSNFIRLLVLFALISYTFNYGVKKTFDMKPQVITQDITWIYPNNNYATLGNKTFIYGSTKSKKPLYVDVNGKRFPVTVYSNGNFLKTILLSEEINKVSLIHDYKYQERVISRQILTGPVGKLPKFTVTKFADLLKQQVDQQEEKSKKHFGLFKRKKKNTVIVIDPGHGGKEPGTTDPKGKSEKDYNLEIAFLLYDELVKRSTVKHAVEISEVKVVQRKYRNRAAHAADNEEHEKHDIEVYLVRKDDSFVSLNERVQFARKKDADILISIHHNALPDYEDPLKYEGVEVFYWNEISKDLAGRFLKNIALETNLKPRGIIKRNFALVRPRFCKAVLIECGYLIHPEESEYLNQQETQEKIVEGIVNGLLD